MREQRAKRRTKGLIAAGLATCALTGGIGIATAPEPAQAVGLDISTAASVLGKGKEFYDWYAHCKSNQKTGQSCFKDQGETINDIYKTLNDYVEEYRANEAENKAAFNKVMENQQVAQHFDNIKVMKHNQFKVAKMLRIYQSVVDCQQAVASGRSTCNRVDEAGTRNGSQPATQAAVDAEVENLTAMDQGAGKSGESQWSQSAEEFMWNIGGTSSSPYSKSEKTMLNTLVSYLQGQEAQKQGLPAGNKLTFMPADYVNDVGRQVAAIVEFEKQYSLVRAAAARFEGYEALANTITRHAQHGMSEEEAVSFGHKVKPDSKAPGKLSVGLDEQLKTYTAPNWSGKNELPKDQAYIVAPNVGVIKITNKGNTESGAMGGVNVPTADELAAIATNIGPHYANWQKQYPDVLPELPAKSSKADAAVARWWTAPQPVVDAKVSQRWLSNNGPQKTDFTQPNSRAVRHVADGKEFLGNQDRSIELLGTRGKVLNKYQVQLHYRTWKTNINSSSSKAGDLNAWSIPRTIPYAIFPSATDTQQGAGGAKGWSNGESPVSIRTSAGHEEDLFVKPYEKYQKGFSAPTWDTYASVKNVHDQHKVGSVADVSTEQSWGPGIVVQTAGVTAGNLDVQHIAPMGLAQL